MDRPTDLTKLIVTFRNFANASNESPCGIFVRQVSTVKTSSRITSKVFMRGNCYIYYKVTSEHCWFWAMWRYFSLRPIIPPLIHTHLSPATGATGRNTNTDPISVPLWRLNNSYPRQSLVLLTTACSDFRNLWVLNLISLVRLYTHSFSSALSSPVKCPIASVWKRILPCWDGV